jgi:2-phospho-L-lactate guanylyltransferase
MTTSQPIALVPVRDPRLAKTRLAGVMSVDAREVLVGAMLADVIHALAGAGLSRIVVLASGAGAAAAAAALGVDVLRDPPGEHGLDAALSAAAGRIRAHASLVVPADLPCLHPRDVVALLGTPGEVVVAPTHDGGTGALLRRPAWAIETSYGVRSAARHLLSARNAGLAAERVDIPGFAGDVDDAQDLIAARDSGSLGKVTSHVLHGDIKLHLPEPQDAETA